MHLFCVAPQSLHTSDMLFYSALYSQHTNSEGIINWKRHVNEESLQEFYSKITLGIFLFTQNLTSNSEKVHLTGKYFSISCSAGQQVHIVPQMSKDDQIH